MYEIGDDNVLDELSRNAAGQPLAPGKPDWNALQKKLDVVLPVEKRKRRVIAWWWLPVGIGMLALGYGLLTDHFNRKNPAPESTTASPTKIKSPVTEPAQAGAPRSAPTAASSQHTKSAMHGRPSSASGVIPTIAQMPIKTGSLTQSQESNQPKSTTEPGIENRQLATEQKSSAATNNGTAAVVTSVPATMKDDMHEQAATENTAGKDTSSTSEMITRPTRDSMQNAQSVVKVQPAKGGRGLSFGLIAGIDKSTVKFTYDKGPGYNLGFELGYHFSNRWSLHTGAIYTRKNYKMAGKDFTAPKGSWVSYYKLEDVDGYCRMWEVPLELRMVVNPGSRKSQFFIATGLSSYFMTHENYTYSYYYNNNLVRRNSDLSSSDTHVLSILNLSVGMQRKWNSNTLLLIEPYARIPMGGVGFGNIRLSSFGVNLGVQWRNVKKH